MPDVYRRCPEKKSETKTCNFGKHVSVFDTFFGDFYTLPGILYKYSHAPHTLRTAMPGVLCFNSISRMLFFFWQFFFVFRSRLVSSHSLPFPSTPLVPSCCVYVSCPSLPPSLPPFPLFLPYHLCYDPFPFLLPVFFPLLFFPPPILFFFSPPPSCFFLLFFIFTCCCCCSWYCCCCWSQLWWAAYGVYSRAFVRALGQLPAPLPSLTPQQRQVGGQAAAGFCTGMTTVVLTNPLDVLRTRLQVEGRRGDDRTLA